MSGQLESVYEAEYFYDMQAVILTDLVAKTEAFSIEFRQFQRMNRLYFGPQRAESVDISLCGGRKVVVSWKAKKVGLRSTSHDFTNEFFKKALSPDVIQEHLEALEDPLGDPDGFQKALMGIVDIY